MQQTRELKGYWKFAQNKEWKISGVLKLESTGITLATVGILDDGFIPQTRIELILGQTNEGYVTLINCFTISSNKSSTKGSIGYQVFSANWCVIGKAFESFSEMNFATIAFRFQHLDAWASVHGFKEISMTLERTSWEKSF